MTSSTRTPGALKGESVSSPAPDSSHPAPAQDYTVIGALITAYDKDGKIQYLYRGSIVPSYVTAAELERLTAEKLIAKSDTVGRVHVSDIAGLVPALATTED